MALKLFNTISKQKEEFVPIEKNKVKFYSCGPTVYNFAHIGNFRAYMTSDILKRYLIYKGFSVNHVMNITDVDDKTIRDSQKERVSLKEFTEKYTEEFMADMKTLNIMPANIFPKATDYINEMIDIIKTLMDKGLAYQTDDGVYFKISEFKSYGKLSKIDLSERKESVRINNDEYDKESAHDFALWKFWTPDDGKAYWETVIGKGRPGWHIECSAMSMKNLGPSIDIHSGGVDLIFPHHENEIAQSEGSTGKPFVKYWFHNEYIMVDGKKMSKSLGNFYTLRDILNKGYSPKAIRYLLMSAHYKQQLNFTFDGLQASQNAVDRLVEFMDKLELLTNESNKNENNTEISELIEKVKTDFESEMDDDLNISGGLAKIFEFVKTINKLIGENQISHNNASEIIETMNEFDSILGILKTEKIKIPQEILDLVEKRKTARASKDWDKADKIRDQLKEKGWSVDDTLDGIKIKKILLK